MIRIDEHAKTPKYRQIIQSVVEAISQGELGQGDKLPSVNSLLIEFDLSRDTIVKAYEKLKERGLIESVPGKGYYVTNTNVEQKAKVFLLFNKLSAHKKIVFDAFYDTLGEQASIDFHVYHNNFRLFKQLIISHLHDNYTHFVIIAHFLEGGMFADEIINQIPKHKLIILDKIVPGVTGEYQAVYQNFDRDIYQALNDAVTFLKKYQGLNIIFPPESYHPIEILDGFERFCQEHEIACHIVKNIDTEALRPNEVYLNLMEDDLVTLIRRAKGMNLVPGKDIGIISYNETPVKEILMDGITVVSTDFVELGRTAARMVLGEVSGHVANPFHLIVRQSL